MSYVSSQCALSAVRTREELIFMREVLLQQLDYSVYNLTTMRTSLIKMNSLYPLLKIAIIGPPSPHLPIPLSPY